MDELLQTTHAAAVCFYSNDGEETEPKQSSEVNGLMEKAPGQELIHLSLRALEGRGEIKDRTRTPPPERKILTMKSDYGLSSLSICFRRIKASQQWWSTRGGMSFMTYRANNEE